jgi:ethanolamine utilization protein EutA
MASVLMEVIDGAPTGKLAQDLMLTPPLADFGGLQEVDFLMFSGGVSEYVYGREQARYGDLGPDLGRSIRHQLEHRSPAPRLVLPTEGIRATAIGASEYTIQASGETSYLSNLDMLPVYGLKVLQADLRHGAVATALQSALKKLDLECFTGGLALALCLDTVPAYARLRHVAEELQTFVSRTDMPEAPLFVILDVDVAKALGGILKEELGMARELWVIDGIDAGDLDYVDVGRPLGTSDSLPVTVKSLTFPGAGSGTRRTLS